jgi:hypothetical protein
LLQPLQAHRLGQVVDGFEVESLERVLGVRGDEYHRRRQGQAAQLCGQFHAAAPGHVDVEQHHMAGHARCWLVCALTLLLQPHHRLGRIGGLADHRGTRFGASVDQRAQPKPRELLVIDEQDTKRLALRAHAGTTMRTTNRSPSSCASNCAVTSCIKRSRSRTLASAMP